MPKILNQSNFQQFDQSAITPSAYHHHYSNDGSQRIVQLEADHDRDNDRPRHDERLRQENERHEEKWRCPHESERE
ncbi:hypothetical protein [Sporomusa carbonis]|uniref:hypothetical protein n=1 Tax=Sporomusa carbonis TaxID=3076075 RepID=UPI003C7D47D1